MIQTTGQGLEEFHLLLCQKYLLNIQLQVQKETFFIPVSTIKVVKDLMHVLFCSCENRLVQSWFFILFQSSCYMFALQRL